jgi:hypothetical protein
MPSSIPTAPFFPAASKGYRVWSAPDQTGANGATLSNTAYVVCPPAYGATSSSSTVSYSAIGYEQSWALNSTNAATVSGVTINTTQELQIYNGLYQSASGSSSSGVLGYANYSTYYATSPATNPDYSITSLTNPTYFSPAAYRYATFCWLINSGVAAGTLTFTINDCNCTSTALPDTVGPSASNSNTRCFTNSTLSQSQRYLMFYRTEQVGSISPTGNTSLSSIWIDANSVTYGTLISGTTPTYYPDNSTVATMNVGNYFDPSGPTITTLRGLSSITVTNPPAIPGNISIAVPNITANTLSSSMYVYCRLGIPMNEFGVSFSGVTLSLSI